MRSRCFLISRIVEQNVDDRYVRALQNIVQIGHVHTPYRQAVALLGREFGLTPDQTQAAVTALLPAISTGLKRSTATPEGLANLFRVMGQQKDLGAMDSDPTTAFAQAGQTAGNDVLAAIFGSPDVNSPFLNDRCPFQATNRFLFRPAPTNSRSALDYPSREVAGHLEQALAEVGLWTGQKIPAFRVQKFAPGCRRGCRLRLARPVVARARARNLQISSCWR